MAYFRIATSGDVALLLEESGLKTLSWPTKHSMTGFANWLFARNAPVTLDTTELAELVNEYMDGIGDLQTEARDAEDLGTGIDSMNAQLAAVARTIEKIRADSCDDRVTTSLGRLATTANLQKEVMRLDPRLVPSLIEALELLKPVTLPLIEKRSGLYEPGRDSIKDALVAHHIVRLDEHLARQPPLDGTTEYWGAEIHALGLLACNPRAAALLLNASLRASARPAGGVRSRACRTWRH